VTEMGVHGDGGITKRADGRLQVSITMPNGRRLYRYVPKDRDRKRQRQLANDLLARLREARETDLDPSRLTLAAFLQSWLESLRESGRVRPRTLESYASLAAPLVASLGGYRLEHLSERHVQRWLDSDHSKSVHHRRNVLRIALNVAVRQHLVVRNVAVAVDLPRQEEFAGDPLSADELRRFLAATANDRLGVLWRLAVVTGLRSGELLGLARDDLDDYRLSVRHQLVHANGGWALGPVKRPRRRDVINLDARTAETLRAHLRRQAAERTADWPYWGLMFVTEVGMPVSRWALLREFHEALDRAGIRRRRVHDLRHSNAAMMRALGISRETRQMRLGHRSDEMAGHYAPGQDAEDLAASERLAEALG
jgi:integrase